jgi:hypothetical protein
MTDLTTYKQQANKVIDKHFVTGGYRGVNEDNALAALTIAHIDGIIEEMEGIQNILLGNDYVPAFSEDHKAVYKADFVNEAVAVTIATLRRAKEELERG